MEKPTIIEFQNLHKRFGGVVALNDVSFKIQKGDIHAIVGENGAGKSTLMKSIAGIYPLDDGKILINNEEVSFATPADSEKYGISMVFQELNNFSTLAIYENIFYRHEMVDRFGFLNKRGMIQKTHEILQELCVDFDPRQKIESLSLGQKQIVEIARAIFHGVQIIIMDEPNSALNKYETDILFELIHKLKNKGITILYISHRLEEVFTISDKITVLRDGKHMGTWKTHDTTKDEIVSSVVGRKIVDVFPTRKPIKETDELVIKVDGFTSSIIKEPVDFSVRKGEVLGFAGLEGSGVQDIFLGLFGLKAVDIKSISLSGKKIEKLKSFKLLDKNFGMIPANRREEGLMLNWPIYKNITFNVLGNVLDRLSFLNQRKEIDFTQKSVELFNIATDNVVKDVNNLSGGNQQKVVLAKWLATNPSFLILNDPTRGIDVGSKHEIYKLIKQWSDEGMAIIFTSSEIEEIIGLCDRIMVMFNGRNVANFDSAVKDKEEIMKFVLGGETIQQNRN